jgi:hypothetical protein
MERITLFGEVTSNFGRECQYIDLLFSYRDRCTKVDLLLE